MQPYRNEDAQESGFETAMGHAPEADGIMSDLIFKLTVNQLVAVLRSHGVDGEANIMLGMLESLVIAGEISLPNFMSRVQNLFPHLFDRIDPQLIATLQRYAAE